MCRMEEQMVELDNRQDMLRQYLRELLEEIEFFRDEMWQNSGDSDTWSDGFRSGKGSAAHRILKRIRAIMEVHG